MNPPNPRAATSLEIRRVGGDSGPAAVLRLTGNIDADTAPALADEFRRLLDAGVHTVELDVREVPFVSSMGVGCIIAAVGDFQGAGGDLCLVGLSTDVRQVFEMLDLLDYVKVR